MEILQGTVLSRRKAPKGLTFLSVQVYPDCSPSVSKLPDSEALSQLVINPESVNSSLLKVCCGCVIRASCSLDSEHKNDTKWGICSYLIIEYQVISSPRENADEMGRWKQHPSVEARARGLKVGPVDPKLRAQPPLCR